MSSTHLKNTARGLASLGRGPDTMLVHMAPAEVEGLQALAVSTGGSLTINPYTGLPEAGWLSSLLPVVAGAAATFFSGGTLAPIVAGALAGGAGAKIEGEDPLMGAMMGGLGGFSGGSLSGLFSGAGAQAAGQGAAQQAASTAAGQGLNTAGQTAGQNIVSNAISAGQPLSVPMAAPAAAANAAPAAISNAVPAGFAGPTGFDAFKQGVSGVANPQGRAAIASTFKGMSNAQKLGVANAGVQTATAMGDMGSSKDNKGVKSASYYHAQPVSIDPVTGQTTFAPGYWSRKYDYNNSGMYDPNNLIPDTPNYGKKNPYAKAAGGIAGLPEAASMGSRMISGPGDGVSDSIPAMIDGNQPAALGSGEFVVDAMSVARLGNGSTDAGAQRLYNMMHRLHAAPSQPGKDINPEKYLPA